MLIATVLLLLQVVTSDLSQPQKKIVASESRSTSIPLFFFNATAQCDLKKDTYFLLPARVGNSPNPSVMKLDGADRPTLYRIADPALRVDKALFHVSPTTGKVFLLVEAEGKLLLFEFENSGNKVRSFVINAPLGLIPEVFAVSKQGEMLVGGFLDGHAGSLAATSFAGIFDANGALLKRLDNLSGISVRKALERPYDQAATTGEGEEDEFYVALWGKLTAVSTNGTISFSETIPRDVDTALVSSITQEQGKLILAMAIPSTSTKNVTTEVEVVDQVSGKLIETAIPDTSVGNALVCTRGGYKFLKSDGRRVMFVSGVSH